MAGTAMLKLVKRRGSLAALVTAGGVVVVVLAQRVVEGVVGMIVGSVSYEGTGFGDILGWVWGGIATSLLAVVVPFAVGVALSLWLLAPISPELRLAHVITRTLLAASAGAVLVLVRRRAVRILDAGPVVRRGVAGDPVGLGRAGGGDEFRVVFAYRRTCRRSPVDLARVASNEAPSCGYAG